MDRPDSGRPTEPDRFVPRRYLVVAGTNVVRVAAADGSQSVVATLPSSMRGIAVVPLPDAVPALSPLGLALLVGVFALVGLAPIWASPRSIPG